MDLKNKVDVIIVGSGPAGAAAAKALTGSGLDTLIMEKCRLPRDKICSGILFPSSVKFINENFGELPDRIFCEPRVVKGNRVFVNFDSGCMDLPFTAFDSAEGLAETGFNALRSELDYWLCSLSDASIADDCLFITHSQGKKEITVKVRHSDKHREIKTRYLIGADGPQSKVRRTVSPAFDKDLTWIPVYEEWYTGDIDLEPGYLYIFLDRRVTGYMSTVFHKDNAIHVTVGARPDESPKEVERHFVDHLKDRHGLKIEKTTMTRGIILNDMTATKNYHPGNGNVILCGEAAGMLRGGEGITSALITGKAAGESIITSRETGKAPADVFSSHEAYKEEKQQCEMVHATAESILGYNIFTRE
jgi:flavin-dependent dehydrogenase